MAAEKEGEGATSTGGKWWKTLSKLKLPPKVQIFWWRVINGFLPCKAKMKRRHIRGEGHCDACENPSEDLYHVLVSCPWARRFWVVVKESMGKKLPELHPTTWRIDLLTGSVCSKQDAAISVCGCWSLWSNRNDRAHGRSRWNPRVAVKHVANIVEELMCMKLSGHQATSRIEVKWKPPDVKDGSK